MIVIYRDGDLLQPLFKKRTQPEWLGTGPQCDNFVRQYEAP